MMAGITMCSGLDSESAFATTGLLRQVADSGRTVIATIHQPSSDIFLSFDKLCLLAEGRLADCCRCVISPHVALCTMDPLAMLSSTLRRWDPSMHVRRLVSYLDWLSG
jgi:hypothetical protein